MPARIQTETPRAALDAFLAAFRRLDIDGMLACFAGDATAFFPAEHERRRLEGKEAIRAAFAVVIDKVKAAGAQATFEPVDLRLEEWVDTALATFHLPGEPLCRRSVLLRREAGRWRIAHLHASNAPAKP